MINTDGKLLDKFEEEIYKIIDQGLKDYLEILETSEITRWEEIDQSIKETFDYEELYKNIFSKFENLILSNMNAETLKKYNSNIGGLTCCSYSFNRSDAIYSCSDCSMDPTCVMCENCFLHSIHKEHRFSFTFSQGNGGCCDCGDPESWKAGHICDNHSQVSTEKIFDTEQIEKIKQLFNILISYVKSITVAPFDSFLFSQPSDKRQSVVLFNDENHEFNEVINIFINALSKNEIFCHLKTHLINHYGMTDVFTSENYTDYTEALNKLERYSLLHNKTPLKTLIIPTYRYQHMCFSPSLLKWIYIFSTKKNEILNIFCHVILEEQDFVHFYIQHENCLWKSLRHSILYYIFNTLLYSHYGRHRFAEIYSSSYETIFNNYYTDSHAKEFFLINLSVQFITSYSIILNLMEDNFIYKVITCLSNSLKQLPFYTEKSIIKTFKDISIPKYKINKAFNAIEIIHQCLFNIIDQDKRTVAFTKGLYVAIDALCDFLIEFNNLDEFQKCKEGKESDDQHAICIQCIMQIHVIMKSVSKWIISDKSAAIHVLRRFHSYFKKNLNESTLNLNADFNTIFTEMINTKNINFSTGSMFDLVGRFFTDILTRTILKEWLPHDLEELIFKDKILLLWILQDSMFSYSFYTQFFQRMWRRNPDSMIYYAYHYKHPQSYYFHEQDFNLFQLCAAYIDPSIFIPFVFFKMIPYFPYFTGMDLYSIPIPKIIFNNNHEYFYRLLEEILVLFYNIFTDRHMVGEIENREYYHLKWSIIHRLASSSCSRKVLTGSIIHFDQYYPSNGNRLDEFVDSILSEVADLKAGLQDFSTYYLKNTFAPRINRFYYKYSLEDMSNVYDLISKNYAKDKNCVKPPPIPKLLPFFHGIEYMFLSEQFYQLLYASLFSVTLKNSIIFQDSRIVELVLLFIFQICSAISTITPKNIAATHLNNFLDIQKYMIKDDAYEVYVDFTLVKFLNKFKSISTDDMIRSLIDIVVEEIIRVETFLYQAKTDQEPKNQNIPKIDVNQMKISDLKKLAKKSKEASLLEFSKNSENFVKNNPDWLLFNESLHTDTKSSPNEIIDKCSHTCVGPFKNKCSRSFNIDFDLDHLCSQCQTQERCDFNEKNLFYCLQTEFLIHAKLKLSRLLSDHSSTFDHITPDGKLESKYILGLSSLQNPHLLLSGCGHTIHIGCTDYKYLNFIIRLETEVFPRLEFKCSQCTTENSLYLPLFYPIYYNSLSSALRTQSLSSFLNWADNFISSCSFLHNLLKDNSGMYANLDCSDVSITNIKFYSDMRWLNQNMTITKIDEMPLNENNEEIYRNLYLPNFYFLEYFVDGYILSSGNIFSNDLEKTYLASHQAYVSTLSCLEIINRHSTVSLFHHSFIETINFVTCSHLARFCFYGSGLGYLINSNTPDAVKYIQGVISISCSDISLFLNKLKSGLSLKCIDRYFRYIDFFKFLVDFYFGLTSLTLSMESSAEYKINEIINLDFDCLNFCYIMQTLQIFINFESDSTNHGMEKLAPQSNDIDLIFNFYCTFSTSESCKKAQNQPSTSETYLYKRTLFNYWINHILPFLRLCSLFFYQLYHTNPPPALKSNVKLDLIIELKEMINYLNLSLDLVSTISLCDMEYLKNRFEWKSYSSLVRIIPKNYFEKKISLNIPKANFLDLIIEGHNQKCVKCNSIPKNRAKCMYCGIWIYGYDCSCKIDYISIKSKLRSHTLSCGISHGLYINLKPPSIYYNDTAESYWIKYSIYEDEYGQIMTSSCNRLKLSERRFNRLNYLYQHDLLNFNYYSPSNQDFFNELLD